MQKELVDIAFNNSIRQVKKVSYHKTIDVVFGVYQGGSYDGWLTINLKPTSSLIDKLINAVAFGTQTGEGRVHAGYYKEIVHYWAEFWGAITNDKELVAASCKGILIAGRSKGAAEALLIAVRMWSPMYQNKILVGAIEPPLVCDKEYAEFAEQLLGKENIQWTCYKNDIVPGVPPWFTFPGVKHQIEKRGLGLSIKDHITSTTKEEAIYKGLGYVE